jgi:hypothetical protein
MMLQFGNQHEETAAAAAGKEVTLPPHQKDPKGPRRSSKFHGVSFNSSNKLWEAFVWDPTKKKGDPRKTPGIAKRKKRTGGQWYLGMYDSQEEAAQIHDKAIIKLGRHKGPEGTQSTCPLNFPLTTYASVIAEMEDCGSTESTEEYFRRLRASYAVGYVQGKVDMRGVSPKEKSGKYVATFSYKDSDTNRNLHIYLGSFEDKVEAGKCYDKAALFYKREAARTNFPHDSYPKEEVEAYGRQLEAKLLQKTKG